MKETHLQLAAILNFMYKASGLSINFFNNSFIEI